MKPLNAAWLAERGGLHDARVQRVDQRDRQIIIAINNEWANEADDRAARAGAMHLHGVSIVLGNLAEIEGGWVSDIYFAADGRLHFDFCDREPFVIEATTAMWAPKIA